MTTTNPVYARRDSATAKLRKMGVDKSEYSNRIKVRDDGRFEVLLTPPAPAKRSRTGERPDSIAATARRLIRDGLSNQDVWRELCTNFPQLTAKQKHYPAWYRSEMKRRGTKA